MSSAEYVLCYHFRLGFLVRLLNNLVALHTAAHIFSIFFLSLYVNVNRTIFSKNQRTNLELKKSGRVQRLYDPEA